MMVMDKQMNTTFKPKHNQIFAHIIGWIVTMETDFPGSNWSNSQNMMAQALRNHNHAKFDNTPIGLLLLFDIDDGMKYKIIRNNFVYIDAARNVLNVIPSNRWVMSSCCWLYW